MRRLIAIIFSLQLVTYAFADGPGPLPPVTSGQQLVIPGTTTAGLVQNASNGLISTLNVSPYAPDMFGTGADGAQTCTTAISLTRDVQYSSLTAQSGCAISTNNYRIFVKGTCDFSAAGAGAILANAVAGGNASGATAGLGGVISGQSNESAVPSTGAAGGGGTTTVGGNGTSQTQPTGVQGGSGGAGGVGGSAGNASGTVGSPQTNGQSQLNPHPVFAFFGATPSGNTFSIMPGGAGGAGAAGGGDGTNKGGGGGGGPSSPGRIVLACRTIARGTNTTTGIIQAEGATGGNGGNGQGGNSNGGGGAGGSGGGHVYIVAETATGSAITGAVNVSGGAGGAGGAGAGTGIGGYGGSGGHAGSYEEIVLSAASYTVLGTNGSAGLTSGGAPSGTTGGSAGTGATASGAL
jgi:hypothetical protein